MNVIQGLIQTDPVKEEKSSDSKCLNHLAQETEIFPRIPLKRQLEVDDIQCLNDRDLFNNRWRKNYAANFDLQIGTVPAPGKLVEVNISKQIGRNSISEKLIKQVSSYNIGTSSDPLEESRDNPLSYKNKDPCWWLGRIIEYNTFPTSFISVDTHEKLFDAVFVQLQDVSAMFGVWVPLDQIRPCKVITDDYKTLADIYPNYQLTSRKASHLIIEQNQIHPYNVEFRNRNRTGIVWSGIAHCCPCYIRSGKNAFRINEKYIHHERPERLIKIFGEWQRKHLLRYVTRIPSRLATYQELQLIHQDEHLANYFYHDSDQVKKGSKEIREAAAASSAARRARRNSSGILSRAPDSSSIISGGVSTIENNDLQAAINLEEENIEDNDRQLTAEEAFVERWNYIAKLQLNNKDRDEQLPHFSANFWCGYPGIAEDTTFNPVSSPGECRFSVGALFNLIDDILSQRIVNGFAAIRPPGHHAEVEKAMGFCIYNNVALGTKYLLQKYKHIKKVAIVDWDVHHGNGTESIFYNDSNVLYISIHKFENGQFYPFTGYPDRCGIDGGLGKNVNIAFSSLPDRNDKMGDTEYISAFKNIVIPILKEFQPDMIFVSAGFDLAEGHNDDIGGYRVTPKAIGLMTRMLLEQVNRRTIAVLEGGYELGPLATGATACLLQLIADSSKDTQSHEYEQSLASLRPNDSARSSLIEVIKLQSPYWSSIAQLQAKLNSKGPSILNLPEEWRMVRKAIEAPLAMPENSRRCSIGY